ncbi:trypsin-like peptidase domain-containing protein [Streptomyces sp. NPDC048242]|uniref:S1C family serine protease n=1 Tax=Streptomyces sp. NPDC048242 TaxID=3155026 RepID=UPI0033FBE5E8
MEGLVVPVREREPVDELVVPGREMEPVDGLVVPARDPEPGDGPVVAAREAEPVDGRAHVPDDTAPARPTPLHEPDPYSTPPYGEPGPWAPAPPFQGPGVTPAHGTPYVPSQAPYPTADAPPDPAHQSHAHQTHAHQPHAHQTQAHQSQAHQSQAHQSQAHQSHAPQPHPVPTPTPAPADPWQRYDPWAVPNLQQTDPVLPVARPSRRKALLGWGLVVVLVAGGLGGFAGAWVERAGIGDVHLPQAAKVPAGRAPGSVAGIAARALPSVVTLHVSGDDEAGTGTGFVLDTRGHILTNNHVVAPASSGGEITVTFSTGDTARARVVGRDSGYDLAVVQVSGVRGLTPLVLGDSDDVRVGDPVVAIGAPFDLANTVTSGIISAKERPITAGGEKGDGSDISYVDALQTDAPINPGNSGGPLLDAHAQVIGINSAIRSAGDDSDSGESQSGSIGLGFAIPANQARRVAEELINEGHATHPVIGVTLDMGYTGDAARVSAKGGTGGPAVQPGGPGDRAGLKAGDLVTAVDGHRVHSGEELIVKIRAHRPGDRLRLTVERAGAERVVSLVLGASERN